ncbi:MAG: glycosyltransferase family 2 protein [Stellaceae bacterium]
MLNTGLPVTVVDFDCPNGTRGYLAANFPSVRVAAVDGQPIFNPALARNIGARNSTGDTILFLDCDVMLTERFANFINESEFSDDEFFTCGLSIQDLTGLCLVERRRFDRIGGYDEVFAGWGYEDVDLYRRLEARGMQQRHFPPGLMTAIPHSDAVRLEFRGNGHNKWAGQRLNAIYSDVKLDIEGAVRRSLNPAERQEVRNIVAAALERAAATNQPAPFAVSLKTLQVRATPDVAHDAAYSLGRVFHYTVALG